MKIKLLSIALLLALFSCNDTEKSNTDDIKTENTTNDGSGSVEEQKEALNKQSKECIALMNSLEKDMNAAYAAGNGDAAAALKARIDSAARENVMIGQKLMALDK
jgi:hypothetical protein